MQTSVIITTYNGELFLLEQLESIRLQTVKPNEVLIFDDISTDSTEKIVIEFIVFHNLSDKWFFFKNKKRLGIKENFIKNTYMAKGDVIFFSDQDDVWYPDKIESILKSYELHPEISCISHSTIGFINSSSSIIKKYNGNNNRGKLKIISFRKQVNISFSPAHAISFKKTLFNEIGNYILNSKVPFDMAIGLFSSARGQYAILNKILVKYRIHDKNASMPSISIIGRLLDVKKQLENRRMKLQMLRSGFLFIENVISYREKKILHRTIKKISKDIDFITNRRRLKLLVNNLSYFPMDYRHSLINILLAIIGWKE